MKRLGTGVIGCGMISDIYLKNLTKTFNRYVDVTACADIDVEKARQKASHYGIKAMTVDELMADPSIGVVVNLTVPKAHASVALSALKAKKHVYSEKPLGINRDEAKLIVKTAGKRLRVSCAPDTFLGAGLQTCRSVIDSGTIGVPVAATAFMACHGHERWHVNPWFYYEKGGGPVFDMGPYYITALVSLLGPVARVSGSSRASFKERPITEGPNAGRMIHVDVDTHIASVLDFANGAIATVIMSFDVWAHNLPRLEIYGSEGSLQVPDPNNSAGPVKVRRAGEKDWSDVPIKHVYVENSRGIGVADMAAGILGKRPHRANGNLALHVVDIMQAMHEVSSRGRHSTLKTSCERPAPMPESLALGELD